MKTFFKDEKTIIINSMDYTEALVGKAFLNVLNTNNQTIKVEQRNDINDDFDGFVMTITDKPAPAPLEAKLITGEIITNNIEEFILEFYVPETADYYVPGEVYLITDYDQEKLDLFVDYLETMGLTDVTIHYAGYIEAKTNGKFLSGSYTIPNGMITFHKGSSDESFVNEAMLLTFTEVEPIEKPVITLIGNAVVNVLVGDTYTDEGATAHDAQDGDITSRITSDSNVNTEAEGTYQVRYNVTNDAGLAADTVIRTVTVTTV